MGLRYGIVGWLLLLGSWGGAWGQSVPPGWDSLRQVAYAATASPVERHQALLRLGSQFMSRSLDSAYQYAAQAREVAAQARLSQAAGKALVIMGYARLYQGQRDSAEALYRLAYERYQASGDSTGMIQVQLNLAAVAYQRGDYYGAIDRSQQALSFSESLPQTAPNQVNTAAILNNLAAYHEIIEAYEASLRYYRRALRLKRAHDKQESVSRTLHNLGNLFLELGQLDSARHYLTDALRLREQLQRPGDAASTRRNLARLHLREGRPRAALALLGETYRVSQNLGDQSSQCYDLALLAQAQLALGHLAVAERRARAGLALARELALPQDEFELLELLSRILAQQGRAREALRYLRQHLTLKDSVLSLEKQNEISRLRTLYQTERQTREIEQLQQASALQDAELTRRNTQLWWLGSTVLLLLGLAALLYNRYRLRSRFSRTLQHKNEELQALNATKDKLFSIVAHDLRNPLSAFQSLSSTLEQRVFELSREEIHGFLQKMQVSSHQLYDLLQNLLQWAMSQTGRLRFEPSVQRVARVWPQVLRPLEADIEARNLVVSTDFDPGLLVWADRAMLEIVLRNLLSNAVKFTPDGGEITLGGEDAEGGTWLHVRDTGVGLSEADAARLFQPGQDPHRIGDHPAKGTGLGLQLCRELMHRHGGHIQAQPAPAGGARFSVFFPAG